MSPTSYQTAPPRVTGGGAIIVAPLPCVKVSVNSFSPLAIPVRCGAVWHGSGWCPARHEANPSTSGDPRGGAGGGGRGAGVRGARRCPPGGLCVLRRGGLGRGRSLPHAA